MKVESRLFLFLVIFFGVVSLGYAGVTYLLDGHVEVIGTTVFLLTFLMAAMISAYLHLVGRGIDLRPEDNKDGEIIDGAGTLGFFPPSSIWPFWAAVVTSVMLLGPVFGWWITVLGACAGIWAVSGWCYEYYVGQYRH